MNRSDNNRMIKALAFEKAILEILKKIANMITF